MALGPRHRCPAGAARGLVRAIGSATPPGRDRPADALRALAVLGVVLGHWLVTALVPEGGTLHVVSPLERLPAVTPLSWLLQTLAVFFLVGGRMAAGGWASARARGLGYRGWLAARLTRLWRPVTALLCGWTAVSVVLLAAGAPGGTVRTLGTLVLSPLWFLLVYAGLTALTPWVARLHPLWPFAVVVHVDLVRRGLGGPEWLGWLNLAAGWLVPYCLGAAWARGGHPLWPFAVVVHVDLVRRGLGGPEWLGWLNLAAGWLVPYCLGDGGARAVRR
ncbi:acyltransferase, partial [Streptomyces sp. PU-14G]|uniref:acyltransferase family protein n=1 Tax=Streptomyces sp. PU-14G TaxID=2800808 RepID=UPI0034DFD041